MRKQKALIELPTKFTKNSVCMLNGLNKWIKTSRCTRLRVIRLVFLCFKVIFCLWSRRLGRRFGRPKRSC